MALWKHREKAAVWKAWVGRHRETLLGACGLPESVLRDRSRWASFLDDGLCRDTGWRLNLLAPAAARGLHGFLIRECGDSVQGWLLRDLQRIFTANGIGSIDEQEWQECGEPERMLATLPEPPEPRKLCLWVAACCRRIEDVLVDAPARRMVEVVERFAEGLADGEELRQARLAVARCGEEAPDVLRLDAFALLQVARFLVGEEAPAACANALAQAAARPPFPAAISRPPHAAAWARERAAQCDLLRDVLGNPFRATPALDPLWLAWNDGCVGKLAAALHAEKRWGDLPILADALEEAGCRDRGLLAHLRGPGPHVRGCWGVDLVVTDCR
jgi:hypothetical protein